MLQSDLQVKKADKHLFNHCTNTSFFFPLEVAHYSNIMHSAFREKTGFLN